MQKSISKTLKPTFENVSCGMCYAIALITFLMKATVILSTINPKIKSTPSCRIIPTLCILNQIYTAKKITTWVEETH